jgi:hypothetical protein
MEMIESPFFFFYFAAQARMYPFFVAIILLTTVVVLDATPPPNIHASSLPHATTLDDSVVEVPDRFILASASSSPYKYLLRSSSSPYSGVDHLSMTNHVDDAADFSSNNGRIMIYSTDGHMLYLQPSSIQKYDDAGLCILVTPEKVKETFIMKGVSKYDLKQVLCKYQRDNTDHIRVYKFSQYVTISSTDGKLCLIWSTYNKLNVFGPCAPHNRRRDHVIFRIVDVELKDRIQEYDEFDCTRPHTTTEEWKQKHKKALDDQEKNYHGRDHDMCSICLESLTPGCIAQLKKCSHRFCHPCISSWLTTRRHMNWQEYTSLCPLCKNSFREDDIEPAKI